MANRPEIELEKGNVFLKTDTVSDDMRNTFVINFRHKKSTLNNIYPFKVEIVF